MKLLLNLIFVFHLLSVISTSLAASEEYCQSSVAERIRLLRNNAEVFKKNAAFDPIDSTKPISKYETYRNGWFSYGINTDEVGVSDGVLWNMKFVDEHGDQQTMRISSVGEKYEVTAETEVVVAVLSTVQVLNKQEVLKPEYIPVLEKMLAMYKSAVQFHTNLQNKNIPGIDGRVTHYEITADGLQFEKDFTLKIVENVSKTEINGSYTCRFENFARKMHGKYGNDYTYRVDTDDLTLTEAYASAVM